MIEMLVFIVGVYTVVFGSLSLPFNLSLKGWRARISGFFLLIPLPLIILLSRFVGIGLTKEKAQSVFGIVELLLVGIGIGAALIFAMLTKPKNGPASKET